jgi:two-component system sensor histidine kinase HydH
MENIVYCCTEPFTSEEIPMTSESDRRVTWQPEASATKAAILVGLIALTLGIHYGWLIEPFFGHAHWVHAIHGRFCYIPIVVGAAWFGLRGGVTVAAAISVLVIPYMMLEAAGTTALVEEIVEVVFYFAIAVLSGALFDRELRARRRAAEARVQLERSQRLSLLGQIAAGMAHEVKNPLASIKGAAEILTDENSPEEARREFREILLKEVRRINTSVSDFLAFARPGETRFTQCDLTEVISRALRQLEAQAQKQLISFTQSLEPGVIIHGDPDKLHQVFLNLILNALQASPSGGRIDVALTRDTRRGSAVLEIRDSGPGIPPKDLGRVFEPFFTTKPGGTGLGLAIAASIAEAHGGTLVLANNSAEGATARLTLPLLTH